MATAARVSRLQPTAVNRVLAEARLVLDRPLYSLMRGQPDFATPEHIIRAAEEALGRGRTSYADNRGEPELRKAIAEKIHRQHGVEYDWQREILVTDGATGALATALGTLLELGDEVLLPDPVYDAYAGPIALWGGRAVGAAAGIEGGRFVLERRALEKAWSPRCKLLLVNTPWNPTGTVFRREELSSYVDFAEERNLWLISDEIYEAMTYDGREHVSPVQLGERARKRTVLVNSLSKTYAMTGWRCGYCAGPAEVIEAMLLVWQQSSRGPTTFVQDAAAAALRGPQECVTAMVTELTRRRDLTLTQLRGIAAALPLKPVGGLFVMVDVRGLGLPSDEIRRRLLHEHGVVVIHGAAYGPGGEGTLRVSFAAGGEVLEKGLEALRAGLLALCAQGER